jgi:hypothetical protein
VGFFISPKWVPPCHGEIDGGNHFDLGFSKTLQGHIPQDVAPERSDDSKCHRCRFMARIAENKVPVTSYVIIFSSPICK